MFVISSAVQSCRSRDGETDRLEEFLEGLTVEKVIGRTRRRSREWLRVLEGSLEAGARFSHTDE